MLFHKIANLLFFKLIHNRTAHDNNDESSRLATMSFAFSKVSSVVFVFKFIVTPARTNQAMADLCGSSTFFSDQNLCNADIIGSSEARARIEVAVLNFLKILNSPSPAISDLPLVRCSFLSEALYLMYQCLNFEDFCVVIRMNLASVCSVSVWFRRKQRLKKGARWIFESFAQKRVICSIMVQCLRCFCIVENKSCLRL